jgi:[ribosomal protein S5]-alanine N-acetyltransferase
MHAVWLPEEASAFLNDSMHLELKQCCLRSWRSDDVPAVQRYADNRRIWINLRDIFPHPYSLADAAAFIALMMQQKPETTFAIATASEAIGCIGLKLGEDVHCKTAELGYWLGEPFWGRGIMKDAVEAMVRYAFETFDLCRLHAEPFAGNHASARVLQSAGFTCEGRMEANVFKDGRVLDSFLYAKIRRTAAT